MSEEKYVLSVGFSRRKKFSIFSRLIELVEGSNYSHTFITWHCTNIDRRKVFEAIGSGNRIISNKIFKEKAEVVEIYRFYVDLETLFKVDQYTHDQAGKPYGYKHILGLLYMRIHTAINRMLGLSQKKVKNPFKDGDYSQICCEAGAYVVELATGIDLPGDVEDYGLAEFRELIKEHGEPVPQERIDQINGKV